MSFRTISIEHSYAYLESNCRAELPNSFLEFTSVFSGENKYHESYLSETNIEGEICDGGVKFIFWENKDKLHEKIKSELKQLYDRPDTEFSSLISMLGVDKDLKSPPQNLERFQVISPYRTGYSGVSKRTLAAMSVRPFEKTAGNRTLNQLYPNLSKPVKKRWLPES